MEQFLITGQRQLSGTIPVRGAKNHVLKLIPAAFLSSGTTTISNVPGVEDVARMVEIVEQIGGTVNQDGERVLRITPPEKFDGMLSDDLVPRLRASVVLVGPLLARYGSVRMPHPGGDKIGPRPINFFIDGFEAMGATVVQEDDHYQFEAPNGLEGGSYVFPNISVTGTESLMMAAVLAKGVTTLHNVACEPEVVALAEYLNEVGASIEGAGTHTIVITGTGLVGEGEARVIPDRIEAGSFLALAAAAQAELTITECIPAHLDVQIRLMRHMGVPITVTETSMTVSPWEKLEPVSIVTHEYPGFATDLQAPMTILLTQASGRSDVRETIYEGRLHYTDMLNGMGADITLLDPFRAQIEGPSQLTAQSVESPDIRAGLALLIAALIAEGESTIQNIYHIDRGYERIEERLSAIGAQIKRVSQ